MVALWPGSTHDNFILQSSDLGQQLENDFSFLRGGVMLGDSGYGLKPYLMVPFQHPASQPERRFNRSLKGTRCSVERTIGRMKRRFHVLHVEVRFSDDDDDDNEWRWQQP